MTKALSETHTVPHTFDFQIRFSMLGRKMFLRELYAKTQFFIGDDGAMLFSTFENDRSSKRNTYFRLSNRIFDFWSENVFLRRPTRNDHFRFLTPLGPL